MENLVKDFNKKYMKKLDINLRLLDIQSELGELSKEIIKSQDYGSKEFELTDNLIMEYGDCLYSLLSFGIENNIDPKKALQLALNKYENRFKNKGHIGSNN